METTEKRQKFTLWLLTSPVLGALPWLVNFLIYLIADQITYYTVFRIDDLMFFVIIISATTMVDVLITAQHAEGFSGILFSILLLIQVLIAALFLGISSLNIARPPATGLFDPVQYRLITSGLVLCGISLVTTLSIHNHISTKDKS